jgi:hypothetical protein
MRYAAVPFYRVAAYMPRGRRFAWWVDVVGLLDAATWEDTADAARAHHPEHVPLSVFRRADPADPIEHNNTAWGGDWRRIYLNENAAKEAAFAAAAAASEILKQRALMATGAK